VMLAQKKLGDEPATGIATVRGGSSYSRGLAHAGVRATQR
jgi:hypothetical protein